MSTSYSPKIITDGLVYCIDPTNIKSYVGGDNYIYDLAGNGYRGSMRETYYTASNLSYGSYKGYLRLDGITNSGGGYNNIDFQSTAADCFNLMGRPTTLTYAMWVKIEDKSGNSQNLNGFYGPDVYNPYLYLEVRPRGPLVVYVFLGSDVNYDRYYLSVSYGKYYNKWTYLAVSVDANNIIRCYINGKLIGTQNRPYGTIQDFPALGGTCYSRIGMHPYFYNLGPLIGGVSSTQLYNRTLSETEITQNYNATKGRFVDPVTLGGYIRNIEYLIVGGGGAGKVGQQVPGGAGAGGGGAGGVLSGTYATTSSYLKIDVGVGGVDGVSDGMESSIDRIYATGGQNGALGYTSGDGGSGGGSAYGIGSWAFGKGAQGEGNDGGYGEGSYGNSGGGGGAGSKGGPGRSVFNGGGSGGDGILSSITGVSLYYGGGGGGGDSGSGGLGGGGRGGTDSIYPQSGSANTGGGGGGGGTGPSSLGPGGNGGSGIVIVAYPTSSGYNFTVSGSLTYTTSSVSRSGYMVASFLSGSGYMIFS